MSKTPAVVANINARSAISTAKTTAAIGRALDEVAPEELERGTIDRAVDRAFSLGWRGGVKDATEL